MLDAADNVLRLDCVDVGGGDFAGEEGIFALGLKGAAVARLAADEVDVAAEVDVDAVVGKLGADDVAVLGGFVEIEAGGVGDGRGKCSGGTNAVANADAAVGEVELGDAETRNARNIAGCAEWDGVAVGEICGHAALHELEFLSLGHEGEHGGGAGVGRVRAWLGR